VSGVEHDHDESVASVNDAIEAAIERTEAYVRYREGVRYESEECVVRCLHGLTHGESHDYRPRRLRP